MDAALGKVLDSVYASATDPSRWRDALGAMCGLFNCHFGDAFARSTDFQTYRGVAHGLDERDYQHGMLDGWVKRNVWAAVHPVREAGHVVTTRQMIAPAALKRSEMYAGFLDRRDLHEGLRFDLWAADGWVQDISLLRSWSAGPFTAAELGMARWLLPHLQRAAAVARRLQDAEAMATAGFAAADLVGQPLFLTDGNARVLRANAAGEGQLAAGGALSSEGTRLAGATVSATARLRSTVARAARPGGQSGGRSGHLQLHRDGQTLSVVAMPVAEAAGWTGLRGPGVLVMAGPPPQPAAPTALHLATRFDLTVAEGEVARLLVAGRSVAEIAADTHRSVNTVRTHVSRLMAKTHTHRQGALVHLLTQAPPEHPEAGGPRFA